MALAAAVPSPLRSFVELESGDGAGRWSFEASQPLCVGPAASSALFGGVGLAGAILALEAALGQPAIWVSAQFLETASKGAMLTIDTNTLVAGRHTSQANAIVREGERVILSASAALGARPSEHVRQWARAPETIRPAACSPLQIYWPCTPGDMHSRLDVRIVAGWGNDADDAMGYARFWVRPFEPVAIDRALLSVVGDLVPAALGAALDRPLMSSLDNSIRFFSLVPTRWVLCDVRLYGTMNGFGHGRLLMYAEDGTLLAMASQSVILRSTRHGGDQ